jgi:alkylhydroperoxidase family enzyme
VNHFSFSIIGPGDDRQDLPEPRQAEPGRWPKLEAALTVVNRDLRATLPDQDPLILMCLPAGEPAPGTAPERDQIYVAMPDGRWQGNAVNAYDLEEGEATEQQLGAVPEPVAVLWNNPKLAEANQEFSARVGEWDAVDGSLKTFAHMAVAVQVGCSWCLDVNYFHALNQNLDLARASQVPRWRESEVFTPLERDVLEYAEAMTNTPPTVTDELSKRLLDQLGPPALVELTVFIGFANFATRCNTAHGITSQGYSEACEIPLAARPDPSGAASTS